MYQESRNIMVKKLLKGILVTGVMVMGISGCSSNVQDDSKQKIVSIQKMDKSFKSEKREEKLDTLKKVLKSQSKYLKEENQDNNVLDQYKKTVTKMRKYFISDYEKSIKENTLENVESIQDKQQINEKKDNLNALKTLVSEEYKFMNIPWWRSHPIHENRATKSIWTEPCNPLLRATKSTKRATSA